MPSVDAAILIFPAERMLITFTPTERDHIGRTVARAGSEGLRGGGNSVGVVAAHFRYIDGRGEAEIETDDGERRKAKGVARALLEDWCHGLEERESKSLDSSTPGRKPTKLVHNLVFSMPVGTPPEKLLEAVGYFAKEKFALQHRYAMALHTDQEHPHAHVVVKTVSEQGVRLNIRKATLREWRRNFPAALRKQDIAATQPSARYAVRAGRTRPTASVALHVNLDKTAELRKETFTA